jgi:hypothetical protein
MSVCFHYVTFILYADFMPGPTIITTQCIICTNAAHGSLNQLFNNNQGLPTFPNFFLLLVVWLSFLIFI